jgi:hypothetical protein
LLNMRIRRRDLDTAICDVHVRRRVSVPFIE